RREKAKTHGRILEVLKDQARAVMVTRPLEPLKLAPPATPAVCAPPETTAPPAPTANWVAPPPPPTLIAGEVTVVPPPSPPGVVPPALAQPCEPTEPIEPAITVVPGVTACPVSVAEAPEPPLLRGKKSPGPSLDQNVPPSAPVMVMSTCA